MNSVAHRVATRAAANLCVRRTDRRFARKYNLFRNTNLFANIFVDLLILYKSVCVNS